MQRCIRCELFAGFHMRVLPVVSVSTPFYLAVLMSHPTSLLVGSVESGLESLLANWRFTLPVCCSLPVPGSVFFPFFFVA